MWHKKYENILHKFQCDKISNLIQININKISCFLILKSSKSQFKSPFEIFIGIFILLSNLKTSLIKCKATWFQVFIVEQKVWLKICLVGARPSKVEHTHHSVPRWDIFSPWHCQPDNHSLKNISEIENWICIIFSNLRFNE